MFVLGAFKDLKPHNWCLTEDYLEYTQQEDTKWVPDADYYMRLISRLVDSIFAACLSIEQLCKSGIIIKI